MTQTALSINIDGAARGNPGPAAYAYVITREGHPVIEEAGYLGHATNNVAEYNALVKALERALELQGERLVIRSDSELLVKQMTGAYRVKNAQLVALHQQAKQLCSRFASVAFQHVRREANNRADELCNEVLDGQAGATSSRQRTRNATISQAATEQVREAAVACLRSVAAAWGEGESVVPAPEDVWEQLWTILEENGVLRSRGSEKHRQS